MKISIKQWVIIAISLLAVANITVCMEKDNQSETFYTKLQKVTIPIKIDQNSKIKKIRAERNPDRLTLELSEKREWPDRDRTKHITLGLFQDTEKTNVNTICSEYTGVDALKKTLNFHIYTNKKYIKIAKLIKTENNKVIRIFKNINLCHFINKGKYLIVSFNYPKTIFVHTKTGKTIKEINGKTLIDYHSSKSMDTRAKYLFLYYEETSAELIDTRNLKTIRKIEDYQHYQPDTRCRYNTGCHFAFSDNKFLFVKTYNKLGELISTENDFALVKLNDGSTELFNQKTGKALLKLQNAWSIIGPDGYYSNYLWSQDEDGTLHIFDLEKTFNFLRYEQQDNSERRQLAKEHSNQFKIRLPNGEIDCSKALLFRAQNPDDSGYCCIL